MSRVLEQHRRAGFIVTAGVEMGDEAELRKKATLG
jgi:hypothetical protein